MGERILKIGLFIDSVLVTLFDPNGKNMDILFKVLFSIDHPINLL